MYIIGKVDGLENWIAVYRRLHCETLFNNKLCEISAMIRISRKE